MACKVVNVHKTESWQVYIGRPGTLGNPFSVREYGREMAIHLWKGYAIRRARKDPAFKAALLACEDQILGCHCAPDDCHGGTFDEIIAFLKKDV